MKIAIDWTENSKGELVGKVLNPEVGSKRIVEEIKNAPIDIPNLRSKASTQTIEIVGVPKAAVEDVEQALAGISESVTQISSCKCKLNLEPGSFVD